MLNLKQYGFKVIARAPSVEEETVLLDPEVFYKFCSSHFPDELEFLTKRIEVSNRGRADLVVSASAMGLGSSAAFSIRLEFTATDALSKQYIDNEDKPSLISNRVYDAIIKVRVAIVEEDDFMPKIEEVERKLSVKARGSLMDTLQTESLAPAFKKLFNKMKSNPVEWRHD